VKLGMKSLKLRCLLCKARRLLHHCVYELRNIGFARLHHFCGLAPDLQRFFLRKGQILM
jgi:hypothetical protein